MQCPVCPNPKIPPEQTTCANCGADVTSIRRLQELPARWYNEALALLRTGDTTRAIAKLHAAAELDPESLPIRNLLAKIAPRRNAVPVIAAAVILAVLAFGAGLMTRDGERASRPQRSGILPERQSRPPGRPPGETPVGERARRPPPLQDLETRLAARTDLRVQRDGDSLHVTFLDGLFPSGSDIATPDGRAKLESLARDLGAVRVDVEGFTDSNQPPRDGRWNDNWSLAFSRAHAAVEVMRAAGSSDAVWSASSSGDRATPYPHEGEANQSKNRTVVLHIGRGNG